MLKRLWYGKGFEVPGVYWVTEQVSGFNFGTWAVRFCLVVPESGRPRVRMETAWLGQLSDPDSRH